MVRTKSASVLRAEEGRLHVADRLVDRDVTEMGEGDGDVERVADDIDRAGADAHIDQRYAVIEQVGVVRLDEHRAVEPPDDRLLHLRAGRRDLARFRRGRRLAEELLVQPRGALRGAELLDAVDVEPVEGGVADDIDQRIDEGARPGIPRPRIGRDPDDAARIGLVESDHAPAPSERVTLGLPGRSPCSRTVVAHLFVIARARCL